MKKMTIYTPFKEKIDTQNKDQQFRVLISFEDLSNREKFIEKYKDLIILGKFDFIPSIYANLEKDQIYHFEKEKIIIQIEEDQKLHFSMLDVSEILGLNEYQNSHIIYRGTNINVGIVDDGINESLPSIPNLKDPLDSNKIKIPEKDITHGTIMASVISNQFKDIDDKFIGIAPNVNLIDFKLSKLSEEYHFSDVLKIFEKINTDKIHIDILLISLTTKDPSDGKDILSLACNLYVDNGLIIVSPAGNFGPDPYTIGSPGAAEKVITIGALTKELKVPSFSGRGPTLDERVKPDFCLSGSNIIVPLSNNLRVRVTGTSISASIAVGIIALIKEFNPKISYNAIIDLIKTSRVDLNFDPTTQGLGTIRISDLFEKLDLFHERLVPYSYLLKRSFELAIEFLALFVLLFYLFYFLKIILF